MTGHPRIRSILIANRGEIAVRVMRTCREMGISTVAVYSDADRGMAHVQAADRAYRIGPPPSRESYLNMSAIIDVARGAGVDAIHPGYGFLAENPEFASRVREAGMVFIGPSPDAIRAMGDKTEARRLVRAAGVPTVPGSDGPIEREEEARAFCEAHGFPVLLKAAAGGGGKGMRVVDRMEDLSGSLRSARSEAQSAFGDRRIYLEKYLENPRHVEFQILGDTHGGIVHLGERECSVQRRHQKIVEESPSVLLDDDLRGRMGETAVRAAASCGYTNAGTIEFLVDRGRNFYFLEMNTRLQVEHPVTEMRTGLDLVALQIRIAEGARLPFTQSEIAFRGHAIECRICAEDVQQDYLPSTGRIVHLRPSSGPGIREDRGIEQGSEIPVYYDSLISKLVAWAPTREEAMSKMERALAEYELVGVSTNISLCRAVLQNAAFRKGLYDTHLLTHGMNTGSLARPDRSMLVATAALCALLEHQASASAPQGQPGRQPVNASGWRGQRTSRMRD